MSDMNNSSQKKDDISGVKVSGEGVFTGQNTSEPPKLVIDFDKHEDFEIKHAVALIDFLQIVNKEFAANNVSPDDAENIQSLLNDFVNEVDDLPRKKINTFKRGKISEKVLALSEAVLAALPKTEKSLAAFVPLAPFGELIGKNIEYIMKVKSGLS